MENTWSVGRAREVATEYVSGMGDRWLHLQSAGQLADDLALTTSLSPDVIAAVWVHDIGYAPPLATTGFHPLDGALALQQMGAPDNIVALVAHHTGARFEATQRGLLEQWRSLPDPDPRQLDIVTAIDLATTPQGGRILDRDRITEILQRYPVGSPVHQAVTESAPTLLESSARAKADLALPANWPLDD